VEISETTPVAEPRWPLWAWFAYPALAIAIGGGLGYVVALAREESAVTQPAPPDKRVVAAPQPSAPRADVEPSSPAVDPASAEIEIEPDPVKAVDDGAAPRNVRKAKAKPKPTKSTPCNVYDHMNGC
jgi:hypothetical protein